MPEARHWGHPKGRPVDRMDKLPSLLPGVPKGTLHHTLADVVAGEGLTPQLLDSLSKQLRLLPPEEAAQQLFDATVDGTPTIRILCGYLTQMASGPCAQNIRNVCLQVLEQQASPTVGLIVKEAAILLTVSLVSVKRIPPTPLCNFAKALVVEAVTVQSVRNAHTVTAARAVAHKVRCLAKSLLLAVNRQPRCLPEVKAVVDYLEPLRPAFVVKDLLHLRRRLSPAHQAVTAATAAALCCVILQNRSPSSSIAASASESPTQEASWGSGAGSTPADSPPNTDWDVPEPSPHLQHQLQAWTLDASPDRLSETDSCSVDVATFPDFNDTSVQEMEQQANELQVENAQMQEELDAVTEAAQAWRQDRDTLNEEMRYLKHVILQLNQQNSHLSQRIADLSVGKEAAHTTAAMPGPGDRMGMRMGSGSYGPWTDRRPPPLNQRYCS